VLRVFEEPYQFDVRPPIKPGSYIVAVFKVVGYKQESTGHHLAKLQHVNMTGEPRKGEPEQMVCLLADSELVVDHPRDLWDLAHK